MSLRSDALLAVTGLFPKAISPKEHIASHGVAETFTQRLRSWVTAGQKPFKYVAPPDLDKIWTALATPPSRLEVANWIEGIGVEDPELQADFWAGLTRARQHVIDAWPKFHIDGPAGPQILPLSYDDAHEVWSILQVLDDAERILDEMDAWTLTPSQALAFRTGFPDLYAHASSVLGRAMAEQRAKNIDWALSWEAEAVFNTLHGDPPEDMPPPPPPPQPEARPIKLNLEREQTQGQVSSQPKAR